MIWTNYVDAYGGEGGIRTHVPLRARRFRGAPVTTTSVPLRANGVIVSLEEFSAAAPTAILQWFNETLI